MGVFLTLEVLNAKKTNPTLSWERINWSFVFKSIVQHREGSAEALGINIHVIQT